MACPNLLGPDEELVAAWDVIRNVKQPNNLSDLRFYVKHLEDLGLDADATMTSLAKMFAGDFVLANRDRHYRNFGIIRNVETLEVAGIAPVFDSGSCLWSDAEFLEVPGDFLYMAKPFKMNGMKPVDQLRLFDGYFDWFDPVMLDGYPEEVGAILSQNPNIPERRVATIVDAVRSKVDLLTRASRDSASSLPRRLQTAEHLASLIQVRLDVGAHHVQVFGGGEARLGNAEHAGDAAEVLVAVVHGAHLTAARGDVGEVLGAAQPLAATLLRVAEGHAHNGRVLDVDFQRRRERQIPVGRADDDLVRLGEVFTDIKHGVVE